MTLLLVASQSQQALPQEPPTTVIALTWTFVVAEGVVIAILWRALNEERDRIRELAKESRADAKRTREALLEVLETARGIRRALEALDERMDVSGDIQELLRRSER